MVKEGKTWVNREIGDLKINRSATIKRSQKDKCCLGEEEDTATADFNDIICKKFI